MTKFIAISSGKGGVGKTTTAVNLGWTLTNLGKKVIVLDANLTTPNISVHLGHPKAPNTFHDAILGKIPLTDAVYKHKSGLEIIPASLEIDDLVNLDLNQVKRCLAALKGHADVVILDCAANFSDESIIPLEASDEHIIVTNPDMGAIAGAKKSMEISKRLSKLVPGIVLTKHKGDNLEVPVEKIEKIVGVPVIGVIPDDKNVRKSMIMRYPVAYTHPNSKASVGYLQVAQKILGEKVNFDIEPTFWRHILRKFGIKIKSR